MPRSRERSGLAFVLARPSGGLYGPPCSFLARKFRGPNGAGLAFAIAKQGERPALAVKNSDDALFETYLKHANVSGYYESEARTVGALYKTLTDNKAVKDAPRDDGRKLVAHFEAQGIKSVR
jgi:hypothetical protein